MLQLSPQVPYLLSDDQVRHLHERAVTILDRIGLKVSDERLLRRLRGQSSVRFEDGRVKFDPALVEQMVGLEERRSRPVPEQPNVPEHVSIVTSHHARYIVDPDTGHRRLLEEPDAIAMARLSDALRERDVLGSAPGAPQDLPPRLQSVAQYKICIEWSRAEHYSPISSVAEYRYIREMARSIGEDFRMECYLVSPLRMEGDEVTSVIDYLETCAPGEKPVPVGTTSMPTMGLSAPVDPLAVFVLGIAEAMGGFIALSLAYDDDIQVDFRRANAYPCDFRTGNLVVGSPEAMLIEIVRRDLDRFYRHGSFARAVRTMSGVVGIQTAAEKAAGAMAAALSGYDTWFGGGLIGLDEVFSPVQLLIDCEIRDYALRVAQGFVADEEFDDVAILTDVLTNANDALPFMTHPTTVQNYRKVFRNPRLFRRDAFRGDQAPIEDIAERAREEIKRLLRSHTYRLDADKLREVNKIYARAKQELT